MASKLAQLKSKACQAKKFVATHGTSYYKHLLEQNKQFIQEPATVEKCNELSKKLLYTRLASNMIMAYRLGMNWTQINTYMRYRKYHNDDCYGWW
ncbi:hypothetical protein DCAR_0206126 [Daucus carota subsp. sativus]|uniref:Uncharacterized protein n=1 Tax=Daucus carota subsp. sativus TaxID=79200 RepID=A0AAF0WCC0_DAUCS|nr:hypothetical protein DCAR_0206126 [Daucus carota subsp. sativus]